MAKVPAFQFYAADYLADEHVQLMSLEEEGAYIRALAFCWREGSIPADPEALSRLLKGGSTTVVRVVQARFKQHPELPDRLVHPRLEAERQKQEKWRTKSAEGGRLSAKKREQKSKSRVVEPKVNSSSSSSSSDRNSNKEPSAFAEFMKFLSGKIGAIPNPGKEGKAIQWLLANGYDFEQCCRCYEFLKAQHWRTATITWTTVKAEIGGWLSKGGVENGTDKQRYESASERNARNLRENIEYLRDVSRGSGPGDHQDPPGVLIAGA